VALFFGLSGTGRPRCRPIRPRLIGDDEHGWSRHGVFNFEGGCYAKTIHLSPAGEPEIFRATQMFGTILENVVLHGGTRTIDFGDGSITENTRASYPIHYIRTRCPRGRAACPERRVPRRGRVRRAPPSPGSPRAGDVHFLSGYTAKLAGPSAV